MFQYLKFWSAELRNIIGVIVLLNVYATTTAQIFQPGYPDSVFTEYFRLNSGGWTAGDATLSVPLPDGRTIWLFGDSYLENVNTNDTTLPCLFQIRNCMVVQDSSDQSLMTTYFDSQAQGVLRSTFKLGPQNPAILWPGHGYVEKDTVNIFLDEIDGTNMDMLHTHVAKLQLPALEIMTISQLPDYAGLNVGRAVVTDTARGYYYFYCNKLNWIVWEPFIARALIGTNVLAPLQFYTGSGWTYNPLLATPISYEPVSPGFSVFMLDNKYYLLTQENGYLTCGLGREIYIMESEYPWGPFINKTLVYTINDTFRGHDLLTYNAQAHPAFIENGSILVSYNLNDMVDTISPYTCASQCFDIWHDRLNADTYRPKFIRVPILTNNPEVNFQNIQTSVFPNPVKASERITFECPEHNISVLLFDSNGKKINSNSSKSNKINMVAPSKPGVYFMQVWKNSDNHNDTLGILTTCKIVVYD